MFKLPLNWSKLQLLTKENIDILPAEGGVYRLSYQSADENIYVFYVGEASSLRTTLNDIVNKNLNNECVKTFTTNLKCYFKYALLSDASQRNDCVRTLYSHFAPKCNIKLPEGNIIEININ